MKHEIKYLGFVDSKEWAHHAWKLTINGVDFDYKTGVGHETPYNDKFGLPNRKNKPEKKCVPCPERAAWAHVPQLDDILECLFSDAASGQESFHEFCDNMGTSRDSLKAFDTYRACMEAGEKLRKALGKEYQATRERIEKRNDTETAIDPPPPAHDHSV